MGEKAAPVKREAWKGRGWQRAASPARPRAGLLPRVPRRSLYFWIRPKVADGGVDADAASHRHHRHQRVAASCGRAPGAREGQVCGWRRAATASTPGTLFRRCFVSSSALNKPNLRVGGGAWHSSMPPARPRRRRRPAPPRAARPAPARCSPCRPTQPSRWPRQHATCPPCSHFGFHPLPGPPSRHHGCVGASKAGWELERGREVAKQRGEQAIASSDCGRKPVAAAI